MSKSSVWLELDYSECGMEMLRDAGRRIKARCDTTGEMDVCVHDMLELGNGQISKSKRTRLLYL